MLQESPECTTSVNISTPDVSGDFNTHAPQPSPVYISVKTGLSDIKHAVRESGSKMSLSELHNLQQQIDEMKRTVQTQKMNHLLDGMRERVADLSDPEARNFGRQFVAAMDAVECKIMLDDELKGPAIYVSYSYAKENRGFANEISLNPDRVDDEDAFTTSTAHEYIHAFQKHVAPALHYSPFNPDNRVVVHPADWIMLEALCERDAYTKQAFINTLLAKANPDVRTNTTHDVVNVNDFERVREKSASLADTVVAMSLEALSKPTKRSEPNGRTFVNNYQDIALNNYAAGMAQRQKEGEKNLVFVRLELDDLWQVGNYGVGPNSFGERIMEPLIMTRHPLLADAQEKIDAICKEHGIPPLEKCPTLKQYEKSLAVTVIRRPSQQDAYIPIAAFA